MKAEHINPFITATSNVFTTMIGMKPKKGDVFLKKSSDRLNYDISGIIGIAGEATGAIVISLPKAFALKVTEGFLGEKKTTIDDDVTDAIGEIVNMIAGNAKQIFSQQGLRFKISIPNVIVGKDHAIATHRNTVSIGVKFHVGNDVFIVEASLKQSL